MTDIETLERSIASLREKMNRDYGALAASQEALLEMIRHTHSTLTEKIYNVHHSMWDKLDHRDAVLKAGQQALREELDATRKALHPR